MNDSTKGYLAWTIRIIVGLLFLISAVAKLSKGELLDSPYFALSTFEVKQLYPMGFSEGFAPYFSRTLIGIELALGFLLMQKNYLRNFVIPVTISLLLVFIGHLSYVTFISGNSGNCGCFGELLPMTPIEAIVKNIITIGLLAWLFFLLPKHAKNGNFWVLTTVLFACILWIFMLAPIQPAAPMFTTSEVVSTTNDSIADTTPIVVADPKIDTVQVKPAQQIPVETKKPEIEEPAKKKSGYAQYFPKIDNGKKTLCFFVPGCDHCMEAAKELTEMKKKDKNFPEINIVFMNEEPDKIPAFFEFAGAEYPYKIIEIIPFWKVLGQGKDTPGVKYLWNGNEYVYYWGIAENKFNAAEYHALVKKTYAELKKAKP